MILNKEKGAIIMKKEGICPNCNNVIIVDDQNQANICPICNQPYVSQVAINSYYNQGNAQSGNTSLLDSYTTKVKRLLSVNMWSEAQEVAKEAIKLYPDKYQARVLDVLIKTNNYKITNIEDICIPYDTFTELDRLKQLDNIRDIEFEQLHRKYYDYLIQCDKLRQICNKLPPLKDFEILQVYEMKKDVTTSFNADFFIYKNHIKLDSTLIDIFYEVYPTWHYINGLAITYTFRERDHRFPGAVYDNVQETYILKMRGSIEEKISILEREAQHTYNISLCCPICGDPVGLFRNCRCKNGKSNYQFYWMRNR